MLDEYKAALRLGQREYRARVARGQSPYLAVLDDVLMNVNIVAQEDLGLVNIPAESIVGTKTSGRHTAFASNFMPLLGPDTEFASKWANLCEAHISEGIHTPVVAFEFLNRFYIQEGNKRVSVLKYFGAASIPGTGISYVTDSKKPSRQSRPEITTPDQKLLDMLGYDCPEQVDLGQYAVQMLVREKTGECLALRLINFETTAPNLKEKLDQGGLTVTF